MREMQKRQIGEIEYGLYALNPFKSFPIFTKLVKILGPALVKLLVGAVSEDDKKTSKKKSLMDTDMVELASKMSGEIDTLFEKLDENELETIIKKLLPSDLIIADGKKIMNLEVHFENLGLLHMLQVARFALEVNFKDFLPENIGS